MEIHLGSSELRGVACHMGAYINTCHPTQTNTQRDRALIPASESWYSIYLPGRDGRL